MTALTRRHFLATALLPAAAQAQAADPPARIGHVPRAAGTVDIALDTDDWQPAEPGLPLTTGSAVRSGAGSRAEVHVGSTALRLGASSELAFEQLDDTAVVVQLRNGRASLRLTAGATLALTVDALRVEVEGPANAHVDVDAAHRRASVRAFEGLVTLHAAGGLVPLPPGRQAVLDPRASAAPMLQPAERTPLDQWADQREAREERAPRFTHPEMTGAEALAGHGQWRVLPRMGPVWVPRAVGPNWAPFREGRWIWLPPWGWTWVDAAPWGFAPSHYGRWGFAAGRWGWLPGDAAQRPVYAAALVGFYGTPPGGWGGAGDVVGWYPLAAGEAYLPPYAASAAYQRALNAPHAAPLRGGAAARFAQTSFAATVVPQQAFGDGVPVGAARLDLAAGAIGRAPALGSAQAPPAPRLRQRRKRL